MTVGAWSKLLPISYFPIFVEALAVQEGLLCAQCLHLGFVVVVFDCLFVIRLVRGFEVSMCEVGVYMEDIRRMWLGFDQTEFFHVAKDGSFAAHSLV